MTRMNPPPIRQPLYSNEERKVYDPVWSLWFTAAWERLKGFYDALFFNKTSANPPYAEGTLFYDWADHSLAYYNEADGVTVNMGRETLVRVYNNTASEMVDGQLVYISGANTGWPTVALAKADAAATSQSILGMVTNPIASHGYGYVTIAGVVHDLDTHLYSAGTTLYLSSTTAGGWTSVAPLQPNYVVEIGTVTMSDATTGQILVHIDKKSWSPGLELIDAQASVALPTTDTVFAPSSMTVSEAYGFSYDVSTGIITFNVSGSYAISMGYNAQPPSSNKQIYFYAELKPPGGSWAPITYSGRQLDLPNSVETQVVVTAAKYFSMGSQLRFHIWGSAAGINMITSYLDGLTTVYKPAFRCQIA